ncbi:MAG: Gfo/Idh/MocA family oxidoreductase [Acidobacteriota bacterium]|nr:Gfo/Idh/MocA family oxidoreductase [Acidobacteriota bacterium]MDH3786314.1 Gfo/Idh/MocA family oxidoreductase [Acidobacteriota bacterium]
MTRRVCVVGAGRWGMNHIRTLAGLGCLGGIVEANRVTREELAQAYPGVKIFADLSAAFDEAFDGFTVATPAETHYAIAREIIERGRPVLVEKPIALTSEHARELKTLARQRQVNLMVGHVMLFHPAMRKIKDLIDGGKIGKLAYLYSNRLNLGAVRTEENILWSFAPHDISLFQYFIGEMPREVVSRGGAFVQPHLHDSTMTVLTYPDNVVGHIFVSWLHPFKEHRLVVIGSKGMLSFEDSSESKEIRFHEKGIDWVRGAPIKREGPTETVPYDARMPLTEELSYFVAHLDGTPVEMSDGQNAQDVLEILEKASESLVTQNDATLDKGAGHDYFVHPSSYVDEGVEIGEGTKIWHFSHVQSQTRIGRDCTIGQNVNVGSKVSIGNQVKIQNNVSVYEGVELEDYVFCGPSMVFSNVIDPRSKYPQCGSEFYRKTLVQEGASIGANATIVCGNTIGRHAFIGAGAVVTKDVPDYAVMLGVPAVRSGWACECGQILPGFDDEVICSKCDRGYGLREGLLTPNV